MILRGKTVYNEIIIRKDNIDPNIFYYTLEKMGLKNRGNSVTMCGDEYADIIGAQKANLQSILFERRYKFPFKREIDASNLRKIRNISEILNFIE